VALFLAAFAAERRDSVVLVDAHESAPAVAGRLGLGLEPNLRSAVDTFVYGLGELGRSVGRSAHFPGLDVVSGFPSPASARQVTPREVVDVLTALQASHQHVVVDVDGSPDVPLAGAVLPESAAIVGVGHGSPVGIAGLLAWAVEARSLAPRTPIHFVVNRGPRDRFRQSEIADEITRTIAPSSLVFAATDRRVEAAAWDGRPVARGAFAIALAPLAAAVMPPNPGARPGARRRGRGKR
jgi:MinD-like ATPase involved in chromosome partitioning or flagellar assembly